MSPKSAQSRSSLCCNREIKWSGLHVIGVLLLCLGNASALTHIAVSSTLPAASVSQPYSATIGISGGSAPFNFVIDSGTLPPGLTLTASTGLISGTPTAAGSFNFHVEVSGSGGAAHGDHWLALKVLSSAISVTISPTSASVNSGASQQFTAYVTGTSNTAVTWSASKGSISSSGLFTAPSVSNNTSAIVTATSVANPVKKASATVTVTVSSAVSITTTSLPDGDTSTAYTAALSATGGTAPYAWSISSGSLPAGVVLNSSTGIFSGTPTTQGNYSFTAKVTDAHGGSATQPLSILITSATGSFDGPAELPRVYVQSKVSDTPAPGATINVPAGGNFQAALTSANCGDTIRLQAGATFTGLFYFPAKACDDAHWIVVRTSAPDTSLPPEGTRMTPCYAGVSSLPGRPSYNCSSTSTVLARIMPQGHSAPIALSAGASHYRLMGLEIGRPAGNGVMYSLISTAGAADHIILDRVWVHGTQHDDTTRAINLSGVVYAAIVDSYFNDFHCTAIVGACTDSQTIAGGSGNLASGQWKIVNNFLEASGENLLFGGAGATITPTDIEIRRNHLFKPMIWMRGSPGFVGDATGHPFVVKNHFEVKNGKRILFEANILENTWGGFTQHGFSILLTPRAAVPRGSTTSHCPTCQDRDITIRYCTISHAGAGIAIADPMNGQPPVVQALYGERYSVHDITIDDISASHYTGTGTLIMVSNTWATNVLNSVSINHITGFPDPNSSVLRVQNPTNYPKIWGFTFTNNILTTGAFPVWAVGGASSCVTDGYPIVTVQTCFTNYAFASNAFVATPSLYPPSRWPSGNSFPANPAAVQFVNYNNGNGGNYQLQPSSPYKNAASDGKDMGADVAAIQAATVGVY